MPYKDPKDPRMLKLRRQHYHDNKEAYMERNRQRKIEMRAWVDEQKSVPCMDCEENYPPYVMDMDHRDPKTKVANINDLIKQGSWKKLKQEVEKCDVVCSNCHRERTHQRALIAGAAGVEPA